jgi:hypothetical protein
VIAKNKTLCFDVKQFAEENAHGMRRCAEENLQDFEDEDHGHEHKIHCAAERTQGCGECVKELIGKKARENARDNVKRINY